MKKSFLCLATAITAWASILPGAAVAVSFTLADWEIEGSDYVSKILPGISEASDGNLYVSFMAAKHTTYNPGFFGSTSGIGDLYVTKLIALGENQYQAEAPVQVPNGVNTRFGFNIAGYSPFANYQKPMLRGDLLVWTRKNPPYGASFYNVVTGQSGMVPVGPFYAFNARSSGNTLAVLSLMSSGVWTGPVNLAIRNISTSKGAASTFSPSGGAPPALLSADLYADSEAAGRVVYQNRNSFEPQWATYDLNAGAIGTPTPLFGAFPGPGGNIVMNDKYVAWQTNMSPDPYMSDGMINVARWNGGEYEFLGMVPSFGAPGLRPEPPALFGDYLAVSDAFGGSIRLFDLANATPEGMDLVAEINAGENLMIDSPALWVDSQDMSYVLIYQSTGSPYSIEGEANGIGIVPEPASATLLILGGMAAWLWPAWRHRMTIPFFMDRAHASTLFRRRL